LDGVLLGGICVSERALLHVDKTEEIKPVQDFELDKEDDEKILERLKKLGYVE
jgi:hypothetical protein